VRRLVGSSSYLDGIVLCALTLSTTFVFKNLGVDKSRFTMLAAILMLLHLQVPVGTVARALQDQEVILFVVMQLCAAVLMALRPGVEAAGVVGDHLGAMMACAFVGATIDIGTDGVYVTTLDDKKAKWADPKHGLDRGPVHRSRRPLVWVAGKLHDDYGYTWQIAWMYVFLAAAVILVAWLRARRRHAPGAKAKDAPRAWAKRWPDSATPTKTFFQKKLIWRMLALAFFYRFSWY